MAKWVAAPDPASQAESRALPYESGIIGEQTTVRIPAALYQKLMSASIEAQRVFDYLAMRMSHIFPYWKGTRADFRFADTSQLVVFVLTPMKRFIRVEIRTDATGYRDQRSLFPTAPSPASGYPGNWKRANVCDPQVATAIADDIAGVATNREVPLVTRNEVKSENDETVTLLPDPVMEEFRSVIKGFIESTRNRFPIRDAWRKLDDDGVWKYIVYQVCVVGSSASYERLVNSDVAQKSLEYDSLIDFDTDKQANVINKILRDHGVRYASANISKCPKTRALVRNLYFLAQFREGPTGYLTSLSLIQEAERIERVMRDLSYIKLKGARDLLAELGLATEVIALDSRVLGILRSYGANVPKDTPTDSGLYHAIQQALLTQVCKPLDLTGVELDRILYWNHQNIRKI